jgi:single-strand DNA-binding protein
MNLITIAGRLGRDAELKTISSGKSVANFAVAVDIGRGDKKTTQWIDCSLWGERAEGLTPYLTKGKAITAAGDFNLRIFNKKDGTPTAVITCDVQRLTLQSSRSDAQQPGLAFSSAPAAPPLPAPPMRPSTWLSEKQPPVAPPSNFDDDIPF